MPHGYLMDAEIKRSDVICGHSACYISKEYEALDFFPCGIFFTIDK